MPRRLVEAEDRRGQSQPAPLRGATAQDTVGLGPPQTLCCIGGCSPVSADQTPTVGERALCSNPPPLEVDRDRGRAAMGNESGRVHGEGHAVRVAARDRQWDTRAGFAVPRAVKPDPAVAPVLTPQTARRDGTSERSGGEALVARLHERTCNRGVFVARLDGFFEPCRGLLFGCCPACSEARSCTCGLRV